MLVWVRVETWHDKRFANFHSNFHSNFHELDWFNNGIVEDAPKVLLLKSSQVHGINLPACTDIIMFATYEGDRDLRYQLISRALRMNRTPNTDLKIHEFKEYIPPPKDTDVEYDDADVDYA